ncbi:calcium-binding allergen Ole e 8-like [Cornus florida]|uniref:calcium-binding allergen Ole e 8-like n=1 Tax=Cornus florida TaxID=4283 RepID=UPI002897337F|nr:calcium-binding allergen Ole e 8-like [Cornus florida]
MATNPNPEPSAKPTMYLQDAEEVKKVFNRFDANGDGKISATEFADVMKALGSTTSTEEVSRMMHEIDTDKDGFINLEEFAGFCKGESAADGGDGELREAFDLYDADKNGLISASELHMVLNRLGEKCTVQDCTNMIKTVDSDGDGNVNFDEFKKMMTNTTKNAPTQ